MGKYLTASAILQAEDFVYDEVDCPEWDGVVRIRSLSGAQRVTLKKAVDNGNDNVDEMLCVMAIVDEDGNRVFDQKQITELSRKNTKAISRVAIRILEISGMRNPEKAVTDAEKNSDGTQSADLSYD